MSIEEVSWHIDYFYLTDCAAYISSVATWCWRHHCLIGPIDQATRKKCPHRREAQNRDRNNKYRNKSQSWSGEKCERKQQQADPVIHPRASSKKVLNHLELRWCFKNIVWPNYSLHWFADTLSNWMNMLGTRAISSLKCLSRWTVSKISPRTT